MLLTQMPASNISCEGKLMGLSFWATNSTALTAVEMGEKDYHIYLNIK